MLKLSVPTKFTDRTGSSDIVAVLLDEIGCLFIMRL